MARYVDGFVFAVPKNKVEEYRKVARKAGKVWKEHGALEYIECAGNDLRVKKGMGTSFMQAAKTKPGETVVFSWILYKSKADRDRINKKVMKAPRLASMMDPKSMPVDMKRMAYGGFRAIVDL